MRLPTLNRRVLALTAVLAPLLAIFVYVGLRAGPLAAVPVTVAEVRESPLAPALFGIGAVEARRVHRIGPTASGRVLRVEVEVGDTVRAGQVLAEMDPVDLEQRIEALVAAEERARAGTRAAQARIADTDARLTYAETQAKRYRLLLEARAASEEALAGRQQEEEAARAASLAARADLDGARQERSRLAAERAALERQRANLRLLSPVRGLVAAREADPGATLVAGQAVAQVIDPAGIWIHARFDQSASAGLAQGLPARVILRSRPGVALTGRVERVEPLADVVTEEVLAKIAFSAPAGAPPPLGELAEVTVSLPALAAAPLAPNAALHRVAGRLGVWRVEGDAPRFTPVRMAGSDLDGRARIVEGLKAGDRIVVYSERALDARSRLKVVERLAGAPAEAAR